MDSSIIDVENISDELLDVALINGADEKSENHSFEEDNMNSVIVPDNIENKMHLNVINDTANVVLIEHCYARPHNWKPETNFLKPTKTLFIQHQTSKRKSINPLAPIQDCDDVIDVVTVPSESPTIYDENKARYLMEECDRHATCARVNEGDENWEETISKVNWTPIQLKLFNGMVNILNNDHLARLAHTSVHNEPIFRRVVVDKSVKRVRNLLATVAWDSKLTQWLHQLLIDHLSTNYLSAYLDILQTLKVKLPTFVDKMMYGPNSVNRVGIMSNESLFNLLKKPWDPVASSLNLDKPKKLPNNPVIVVVSAMPYTTNSSQSRRFHKWINLLSNLANVQTVHIGSSSLRMTMTNCVDQMLATTRGKIQEIKAEHSGRPIILAGFNAGAALALQVAQVETVLCVLCLGFSLHTAEGRRGDLDDNLLELQCPVLFVIGQCSNTSLQEEMEDLRERMRIETGLIIVGSADDYLRVNKKKKRAEGITQSVVDRCIVDEIGEFVSGILLSPYPPHIRQSAGTQADMHKRSKIDRKRNNSNGSSLDSEPPSPTPRITRPGLNHSLSPILGRPPGSKSKNKLESKWTAQGITKSPSPIPNSTVTHSDTEPQSLNKPLPKTAFVLDFNKKPSKIFSSSNETTVKTTTTTNNSTTSAAKMQGVTLGNRPIVQSSTLSSLLQGSIRSMPQKQNSSIKVLENLALSTTSAAKLVSSTGRTIDLSKITVLNPGNTNAASNYGNVMLVPDRIKSGGVTRYITSKKQLLGNKPPKPLQKISSISTVSSANLLPPTNLTSQDIMDLPIIFADDNQILTNNIIQPTETPNVIENISQIKSSAGKVLFLNKQGGTPVQTLKPIQSIPNKINKNSVKYAKIILSKKINSDDKANMLNLSGESTSKPEDITFENIDLEAELVATAVPKPTYTRDVKNITLIYKKPDEGSSNKIQEAMQISKTILKDHVLKRNISQAEISDDDRSTKNLKLE